MSGRRILLVTSDLMVGSRIAGLAAAGGATVEQRRDLDAAGGPFDLVIVDLQAVPAGLADAVARLKSGAPADRPVRVVAFGPHVATGLFEAARAAGVDEVVSRGEMMGSFAAVVQRSCG